jgi:hypothetical protein
MRSLRHLRELERVAEQHERPRRRPQRQRIGKRDLARLVDEQVVKLLVELRPREEPGGAGEQTHFRIEKRVDVLSRLSIGPRS